MIFLPREKPADPDEFIRRYPRITSHLIAESLGYFTPKSAAIAALDAINDRENWCEYIYTCFDRDARACLERAIRNRHLHKGYMAEYKLARAIVEDYKERGRSPLFASWF